MLSTKNYIFPSWWLAHKINNAQQRLLNSLSARKWNSSAVQTIVHKTADSECLSDCTIHRIYSINANCFSSRLLHNFKGEEGKGKVKGKGLCANYSTAYVAWNQKKISQINKSNFKKILLGLISVACINVHK